MFQLHSQRNSHCGSQVFRQRPRSLLASLILIAGMVSASPALAQDGTEWQPITLDITGPAAGERDDAPNPFLDIRLDITFTSPSGAEFVVPGFFAGDGAGKSDGSVWRTRFTPDEPGTWNYTVSFVQGNDVAVAESAAGGTALPANGQQGQLDILPVDPDAPGFLATGRLDYVGEHYLKFAEGDYWLKGGVDSPENFFGYAGFDNTSDMAGGASKDSLPDNIHRYPSHVADWQPGDPNFVSEDRGVDGKGIIGAVNYLASEGINSIYFLPMNLGGDGRDTHPFVGTSRSAFDNTHYDVSKLHQWNLVLNHMQEKGVMAHVVLNEQENDNNKWLDNGTLGVQRKLYYREMVARFAYLNGVKWNLSEETRYTPEKHRSFAAFIRDLDWADHPMAVHHWVDKPAEIYDPLLGNTDFDMTSMQFGPKNSGQFVETWRRASRNAGWPWVIDMDEIGWAREGLTSSNADILRKWVLYPVYFSGGNLEWYFGYHPLPLGGDMRVEDFRTREAMYGYMRIARQFMHAYLPFVNMEPADTTLQNKALDDQVFAKAGDTYAVYLQSGVAGRSLNVQQGTYNWAWFDPRNGEFIGDTRTATGNIIEFGASPANTNEDWVILVSTDPIDREAFRTIDLVSGRQLADDATSGSTDGSTTGGTDSDGPTDGEGSSDGNSGNTGGSNTGGDAPDLGAANGECEAFNFPLTGMGLYVQNNTLQQNDVLRVDHNRRVTWLEFTVGDLPSGQASAELILPVHSDRGTGTLTVTQVDAWPSVANTNPDTANGQIVGQRVGEWLANADYRLPLTISLSSQSVVRLKLELSAASNDFSIRQAADRQPVLDVFVQPKCVVGAGAGGETGADGDGGDTTGGNTGVTDGDNAPAVDPETTATDGTNMPVIGAGSGTEDDGADAESRATGLGSTDGLVLLILGGALVCTRRLRQAG